MNCPLCDSTSFTERFPFGMDGRCYLRIPQNYVRVVAISVCDSELEQDNWPASPYKVLREYVCDVGHKFFVETEPHHLGSG